MALLEILNVVSSELGVQDRDTNTSARTFLVDLIQQAAEEIYETTDIPGCLRECYVRVTANKQIALPPFIGKVRGLRWYNLKWPWSLNDLRPRYHYEPWKDIWTNWRLIGYSPVCIDISNSAAFTYTIHAADSALVLSVVGSTINAKREVDTITMSATSVDGTKAFNQIEMIKANKVPSYDVTITDADDQVVAVLYNDQVETRYTWYDVSEYPESGDCSDGNFTMEVLYKMPLPRLYADTDSFPVPGYDYIIAAKAIQLNYERQEGKEERAMLAHQKIQNRLKQKTEDEVGGAHVKTFLIEPDIRIGMFRAHRGYRGRRMSKS